MEKDSELGRQPKEWIDNIKEDTEARRIAYISNKQ